MGNLNETKFFIMKITLALNLILFIGAMFFFEIKIAVALIMGGIISIINFQILSLILKKAVRFHPNKAKAYVFVQYIFRYILWVFIFYILATNVNINVFLAIVCGMLTVKISILINTIFNLHPYSKSTRKEVIE